MTKTDIINETINFYKKSNRGYIQGSCQYYTEEGNMCAVGRCMISPEDSQVKYGMGTIRGVVCRLNNIDLTTPESDLDTKSVDQLLKPEYHGHNVGFWTDLQMLHDESSNWDDDGLTISGRAEANKLLTKYRGQ